MSTFLLIVAALAAFFWWIRREPPDFRLSVRDGQVEVIAGRPPRRLLLRICEIVAEDGVRRGRLAAWREDASTWTLQASGIPRSTLRQLRYVARFPDR